MKKDDVDPDAIAEQERELVKRRNELKEKKVLEAKQSGIDVTSDEFK
jgi:regulator of RNase E activity RraB